MNKTYISSLLVVLLAGAQTIRAQGGMDDVMAQLDAADTATPASVEEPATAAVSSSDMETVPQDDLYARGKELFRAEKYDDAEAVFKAMLAKDPFDRRAMNYLERTAQKISARERHKLLSTREVALKEIEKNWNPQYSDVAATVLKEKAKPKTQEEIAIEAMTEHLKSLRIPTLDFRDANIKDVVLFLTESCRRMDPSGKGVNIILLGLNNDDTGSEGNNITISIRDMSLYDALQYVVEMASLKFEVEPNVVTITPANYVRDVDVKVQSFLVIPEVGEELSSMAGGDDSGGGADDLFGDSSAASSAPTGPVDVSKFFSIVVWPEGSSATYYPSFKKLVVKNTPDNIKAVKGIIDDLEDEAIKKRSSQVEIEAKFVEFNEGALDELGFSWNVYGSGSVAGFKLKDGTYYEPASGYSDITGVNGELKQITPGSGGTPSPYYYMSGGSAIYSNPVLGYDEISNGSVNGQNVFGTARSNNSAFETVTSGILANMGGTPASMLFSRGDVDLKISAMEQEGTADVLSSPRVTTQSGYEAVIRVVEVHRYPQDYDVETGQRTSPVVKPQDWEDFDLGVVLRVTPEVDTESNTIKLELNPEIKKFKGWEDYSVAINAYVLDEGVTINGSTTAKVYGDGSHLFARLPFFDTRTVQTRVTVADGSTVVMGGLVDERTETFRDQVPILGDIPYIGRLFRTEGSRTSKKNLVVFVKATQVDERGMTRADREIVRKAVAAE